MFGNNDDDCIPLSELDTEEKIAMFAKQVGDEVDGVVPKMIEINESGDF